MSRRRPKSHTLPAMYILTAADGYTTCCEASRDALFAEAARIPLLAPITIVHWIRVGFGDNWKRASEWLWNGGLEVGA